MHSPIPGVPTTKKTLGRGYPVPYFKDSPGPLSFLLSFQLKCSSNIDSIHYLGLTNSFDQVPRDIHTLPSIIVNFLLNSLNAPITFVVCATNQS